MNPEDKTLYLLEIISGIKLRSLLHTMGRDGITRFFELQWWYRESLREGKELLKTVLGTRYNPDYTDSLMFLKPDELDLANATKIGEGSFGKVYRTPLKKKRISVCNHMQEVPGQVVIKIAKCRFGDNPEAPENFFQEVGKSSHY